MLGISGGGDTGGAHCFPYPFPGCLNYGSRAWLLWSLKSHDDKSARVKYSGKKNHHPEKLLLGRKRAR